MMCAQTISFPVGSMWNVRQWIPFVSTCWISAGLPLDWSMAKAAIVFSPPANTFLPSLSTVLLARFAT